MREQRKNIMKKVEKVILLFGILIIALCACHNAPKAGKGEGKVSLKDYGKQETHVLHDDTTEVFKRVKALDGHIVYSVVKDNEEIFYGTSEEQKFCSDALFTINRVSTDILDYCLSPDGSMYLIVLETVGGEENIYLKKRTVEGDMVTIRHLNDFHRGETDDCYVWKVLLKPDGSLLVHSYYAYILLDEAGTVIKEDSWEEEEIFALSYIDENALLLYWSEDYKLTFYYVDINTGSRTECSKLPEWQFPFAMRDSDGNLCIGTASCLCSYDFREQKTECLLQWSDFGVVGDNICSIYKQNEEIHCILYEKNVLYDITFAPNEIEEAKTKITLGCFGETSQMREAVAAFNQENPEYVVIIEDYLKGELDAENHLYNEVLAEKGPDIIRFSSEYLNDKQLGQAGMLEDLAPYLERSTVIQREDIVESLYQSMLVDGSLYALPTNFMVGALATKGEWCGEDREFTCDELLQAIEACEMQGLISRDDLLKYGGLYGGYSDEPNDVRLKKYIELANKLPEITDYQPNQRIRREGKIPFEAITLYDMENYMYKKSAWGENVAFAGFPEVEGNGMVFWPINCFGISKESSHKEAAWRFVESFFTKDWQENITPNWDFSAYKEVLEQQLEKSMETGYYNDAEGIRHEIPILTYEVAGEMIDVYAAREEDVARMKEMIDGIKVINRAEPLFVHIVQEEALYYFDGKKSLEDVMDVIDSRVSIYRSEKEV